MKIYLLVLLFCVGCCSSSFGQITLAHHFPGLGSFVNQIAEVNLSRSGRKILTMNDKRAAPYPLDTLFFYNTDYSFWKMIPCPHVLRHVGQFSFYNNYGAAFGVFYPSETLFNTDTLLEVAVFYRDSVALGGTILIVNENGAIMDSFPNAFTAGISSFNVRGDSSGNFHAYLSSMTGADVYNLPGTLPCETCVNRSLSSVAVNDPQKSIISQPIPNPSKDNVKIAFTLPEGVNMAELQVFDMKGQRIRSYKVDNKFGFIMLDNSQLAAGTYLYNIVVDGTISSTQKFVVIR